MQTVSKIRPPDYSKLAKNPKNDNDITIFQHDINVKFFWRCFISLVKFRYWSKFHVTIITGSGIMTIFFYKGLTRNTEIRNTRLSFAQYLETGASYEYQIWPWMSLIECYWMLENSRVTLFTVFELLREN